MDNNSEALSILATAADPVPGAAAEQVSGSSGSGSGVSNPPITHHQLPPLPTAALGKTPLAQIPFPMLVSLQNDLQIGRYLRLHQEDPYRCIHSGVFFDSSSFAVNPLNAAMPVVPLTALGDDSMMPHDDDAEHQDRADVLVANNNTTPATTVTVPPDGVQQQQQGNNNNNNNNDVVTDDSDDIIPTENDKNDIPVPVIPFGKSMTQRQQKKWIVQFSMNDVEVAYSNTAADRVDVGNDVPTLLKSIGGISPIHIHIKALLEFIKKFNMRRYSKFRYKVQYCDHIARHKILTEGKELPPITPLQQQQLHFGTIGKLEQKYNLQAEYKDLLLQVPIVTPPPQQQQQQQQQDTSISISSSGAERKMPAETKDLQPIIQQQQQQLQDTISGSVEKRHNNMHLENNDLLQPPIIQQQQQDGNSSSSAERKMPAENRDSQPPITQQQQQQQQQQTTNSCSSRAERPRKRRHRMTTTTNNKNNASTLSLDVFGIHMDHMAKAANERAKAQREQAAAFLSFAQEKHVLEKWEIAMNNLSAAWAQLRRLKGVVGLPDHDDEIMEVKKDIDMWKALKDRYRSELQKEKQQPCAAAAVERRRPPVRHVAMGAASNTSSISTRTGKKRVFEVLESDDSNDDD